MILLLGGGNGELSAPLVTSISGSVVSGTACAFGRVEIYLYENGGVTPVGQTDADANGDFSYSGGDEIDGKQILLLVTDTFNNTSVFSTVYEAPLG